MAEWLVRSSPDQVEWVQFSAGDIGSCSSGRHFIITVSPSTRRRNGYCQILILDQPHDRLACHPRMSRNTPSHFYYRTVFLGIEWTQPDYHING